MPRKSATSRSTTSRSSTSTSRSTASTSRSTASTSRSTASVSKSAPTGKASNYAYGRAKETSVGKAVKAHVNGTSHSRSNG